MGEPVAAREYKDRQLLHWTVQGLRLLVPREARRAAVLVAAIVGAAILEAGALAAAIALLRSIVEPDAAWSAGWLRAMHEALGRPTPSTFVTLVGFGAILLGVASAAVSWIVAYGKHRFAAACHNRLACDQMAVILGAPYEWHLDQSRPLLVRALYEDSKSWSNTFLLRLIGMTSDLLTLLVALALLIGLADSLALLALVILGVTNYIGFHAMRPAMARAARQRVAAAERIQLVANRVLSGLKEVKVGGREAHFGYEFERATAAMSRAEVRLGVAHLTPNIVALGLGQIVLLAAALALYLTGAPPGAITAQLALLAIVTARALPAGNGVASAIGGLWNAVPYIDSIYRTRATLPSEISRRDAPGSASRRLEGWRSIHIRAVSYRYPGADAWALRLVDLRLDHGAQYGLVGRSAAGKSTLVDILVGLLWPTDGAIVVDGVPLAHASVRAWQRTIGYVPQTPYIADLTLRENVGFGLPPTKIEDERALDCLRLAGLSELAVSGRNGLDLRLGDFGTGLSGGQRQRVAIARALYLRPQLLVFDEATSAVDAPTEAEIQRTLATLRGHVTVLVIAHRMSTVRQVDRLFLLEGGRLVADGTYEELLSGSDEFRTLVSSTADANLREELVVPRDR